MPIPAPRTRSSAAGVSVSSSVPRKRALPCARPFPASRPSTARNTWLLPAPDSPTTPRHSPRSTASVISRAAVTVPRGVSKVTVSPDRLNRAGGPGAASAFARIEGIT